MHSSRVTQLQRDLPTRSYCAPLRRYASSPFFFFFLSFTRPNFSGVIPHDSDSYAAHSIRRIHRLGKAPSNATLSLTLSSQQDETSSHRGSRARIKKSAPRRLLCDPRFLASPTRSTELSFAAKGCYTAARSLSSADMSVEFGAGGGGLECYQHGYRETGLGLYEID